MATCFYPIQAAEDFIPLPETTPPDQISRPSCRRLRKYRIIPEFCAAKSSTGDYNAAAAAAAAASVPRTHHRKRSRDAIGDDHLSGDCFSANHDPRKMTKASPSLGHESEIDPLISQHGLARKIKEKDEEITKMGELNRLLREQVKSLLSENRIWRGLAQDNEAEADFLRSKLEHALARGGGGGVVDDAESSCCGSNDAGTAGAEGGDAAAAVESLRPGRWCTGRCWETVVLLPCRHMCLCASACGPSHRNCPACGSAIAASVHVNLSSP
ncbi:probable BOI-related E3 ubiquitin-protein ligase 3 isoform X2 [Syzygium oleosum]|uniref:probable BOI-related E3 ubiquitin-protein ligase 3 isoform X2 n=1 Tax=Syzygium oleosum TaxID=219896 RepID=UPI0024B9DBBB|nr:probable BOI-related E3 ubiquitin-protein ligase 3 isoform X2 [Syzygium oleosum]XP_056173977.1 probable BOI-related E3 ubiquitin-protein ligase 3 isoform X2 [Syzygium oleosum]